MEQNTTVYDFIKQLNEEAIKNVNKPSKFVKNDYKSQDTFQKRTFTHKNQFNHNIKQEAQKKGQDQFIQECVNSISKKVLDDINCNVQYLTNFRRNFRFDIKDDSLVVDHQGEKFEFSKKRFLSNRFFQTILRNKFSELSPYSFVSFYPGKDYDGTVSDDSYNFVFKKKF